MYLTAQDYLKFGLMYLNKSLSRHLSGSRTSDLNRSKAGGSSGTRVLPDHWSKKVRTPSTAFSTLRLNHDPQNHIYSTGFWLNTPVGSAQIGRAHRTLPDDAYYARGYQGQYILIIPSEDSVIVRLGHDLSESDRFRMEDFRKAYASAVSGISADGSTLSVPESSEKVFEPKLNPGEKGGNK